MVEYLDMEAMNIKPDIFGLPTDALQNIFNYLRIEQKSLAQGAGSEGSEYDRFMMNQVANRESIIELGGSVDEEGFKQRERQFIENSLKRIPYQVALRYFRDLARRRGHDIN